MNRITYKAVAAPLPKLSRLILGLVFLVSSLAKSLHVEIFVTALAAYGFVSNQNLLQFLAIEIIVLESALGGALLSKTTFNRKIYPAILLFLVTVSIIFFYGVITGRVKDCDCFGGLLLTSPLGTFFRNLLFAMLAGVAWRWDSPEKIPQRLLRKYVAICTPLMLTATALVYNRCSPHWSGEPLFANYKVKVDSKEFDLSEGQWLVALLSLRCGPCTASVKRLNDLQSQWKGEGKSLPIIALCFGDEVSLSNFKKKTSPNFPICLIEKQDFEKFAGRVIPRFIYVDSGRFVRIWDGLPPK